KSRIPIAVLLSLTRRLEFEAHERALAVSRSIDVMAESRDGSDPARVHDLQTGRSTSHESNPPCSCRGGRCDSRAVVESQSTLRRARQATAPLAIYVCIYGGCRTSSPMAAAVRKARIGCTASL